MGTIVDTSKIMKISGEVQDDNHQSQWLMLIDESVLKVSDQEQNNPKFLTLRHPKSGDISMYLFSADCQNIYEVLKFQEKHRSWLIGESVQQDGGIYLPTKVDPIYLALTYFMDIFEKDDKFQPLDRIIVDGKTSGCTQLRQCLEDKDLDVIADIQQVEDGREFRYSQAKTLEWLKRKIHAVANSLEKQNINVSPVTNSGLRLGSTKSTNFGKEDYKWYAHGIVSDYIPQSISLLLKQCMNIQEPKREKPEIEEPPAKKARKGSTDKATPAKKSASQKKMPRVKGMKSMGSFFKPKSK